MISISSKSKVSVYTLLLLTVIMMPITLATGMSSARSAQTSTTVSRRGVDLITPAVAGVCIGVAIYVAKSDIEYQYKKIIYALLVTNVLIYIIDQYKLYRPAVSFFSNKTYLPIFILSGLLPLILYLLYPQDSSPIRDYP